MGPPRPDGSGDVAAEQVPLARTAATTRIEGLGQSVVVAHAPAPDSPR